MTLFVAYLLNIIDYLFTRHWVRLYGIEIETNPFGQWLFKHNIAWIFKIVVVGIFFVILGICLKIKPEFTWVSYLPLALYALIAIYHIILFLMLKWGNPKI